eukprot:scaffold363753_cov26-Prasinocladus_malaysianus.AAC.1
MPSHVFQGYTSGSQEGYTDIATLSLLGQKSSPKQSLPDLVAGSSLAMIMTQLKPDSFDCALHNALMEWIIPSCS